MILNEVCFKQAGNGQKLHSNQDASPHFFLGILDQMICQSELQEADTAENETAHGLEGYLNQICCRTLLEQAEESEMREMSPMTDFAIGAHLAESLVGLQEEVSDGTVTTAAGEICAENECLAIQVHQSTLGGDSVSSHEEVGSTDLLQQDSEKVTMACSDGLKLTDKHNEEEGQGNAVGLRMVDKTLKKEGNTGFDDLKLIEDIVPREKVNGPLAEYFQQTVKTQPAEHYEQPGEPQPDKKSHDDAGRINNVTGIVQQTAFSAASNPAVEKLPDHVALKIIDSILTDTQKQFSLSVGPEEIRVKLQPESLGEVLVKIVQHEGKINGRIFVENHLVKELLESHMVQLRERLAQMNIELKEMSVFLGGNPDKENDAGLRSWKRLSFGNRGKKPEITTGAVHQSSYVKRGMLDIFA